MKPKGSQGTAAVRATRQNLPHIPMVTPTGRPREVRDLRLASHSLVHTGRRANVPAGHVSATLASAARLPLVCGKHTFAVVRKVTPNGLRAWSERVPSLCLQESTCCLPMKLHQHAACQ
jgi:hypothetical protein